MSKQAKYVLALGALLLAIIAVAVYLVLGSLGIIERRVGPGDGGIFGGRSNNGLPQTGDDQLGVAPPPSTETGSSTAQRLVRLTTDPIVGATVKAKENKVMYFKRGIGHLFEVPFEGPRPNEEPETRISNFTIKNIISAHWAASKGYALVTTLNDDISKTFWFRLTGTSTITTGLFPFEPLDAAFSSFDDTLAAFVRSGTLYSVVTTNPEGKNAKTVYSTPIPDYELSWATKNLLGLKTKSSAFAPSLFQLLSTSGGQPTILASEVFGLDTLWDSTGSRFLRSSVARNGRDVSLALVDRTNSEQSTVLTFRTLAEKCVFSKIDKNTLFCAAPTSLGQDPLPDSWWQGKINFSDNLLRINTQTGEVQQILEGAGFDMVNLFLSPREDYIFFTNKKDSALWSLRLGDQ